MELKLSKKSQKIIKEIMDGRLFEHPLALVAKAGARLMFEWALEEEVFEALGRDWYERHKESKGRRNGYKGRTVKLSCGDITVKMP